MRKRRLAVALLCLAALAAGCSKSGSEPPPAKAAERPAPRFYYDLGPETVDVSRYPRRQQENYKLFLSVCGTCHGTARPLNSPYTGADTWKRFVSRMHRKMEARAVLPSSEDEERILDFLVYDSKLRKLDRREQFQAQQGRIKALFDEAAKR